MPINQENVTDNSQYQHIQENTDDKVSKQGHKNKYKKYIQTFKAKQNIAREVLKYEEETNRTSRDQKYDEQSESITRWG